MKNLKFILPILALLIVANNSIFGCLCNGPETFKGAYSWAETVFSGKLLAVTNKNLYTFQVENVWKGILPSQIVIWDDDIKYSNCTTIHHNIGEQYLMFTVPSEVYPQLVKDEYNNPALVTIPCGWTISLKDPKTLKKVVKKIGKGKRFN